MRGILKRRDRMNIRRQPLQVFCQALLLALLLQMLQHREVMQHIVPPLPQRAGALLHAAEIVIGQLAFQGQRGEIGPFPHLLNHKLC